MEKKKNEKNSRKKSEKDEKNEKNDEKNNGENGKNGIEEVNEIKERSGELPHCEHNHGHGHGHNHHTGCGNGRCRFGWASCAIILVIICAVGEHIYNTRVLSKHDKTEAMKSIEKNRKDYDYRMQLLSQKVDELQLKISQMQLEMSEVTQKEKIIKCEHCQRGVIREKWRIWMGLKSKLESEEPFEEELRNFRAVFAGDRELIKLVDELINGVEVISVSPDGNSKIIDTCKKYIRKLVRIKKVNHKELLKISGYVLSTIDDCAE